MYTMFKQENIVYETSWQKLLGSFVQDFQKFRHEWENKSISVIWYSLLWSAGGKTFQTNDGGDFFARTYRQTKWQTFHLFVATSSWISENTNENKLTAIWESKSHRRARYNMVFIYVQKYNLIVFDSDKNVIWHWTKRLPLNSVKSYYKIFFRQLYRWRKVYTTSIYPNV